MLFGLGLGHTGLNRDIYKYIESYVSSPCAVLAVKKPGSKVKGREGSV